MPFTLPILYQKAFVELFPAPFPAKKALLPHMSLSVLVTCLLLAPFSIRKTLLPHLSSFLPISGTFLAAFSIIKAFLPHMSFFLPVTCHWSILLPQRLCYPIWVLFLLITYPLLAFFSIIKLCYPIWALFCKMDIFTGRILYQINLSHQNLSSFLPITCPLLVAVSVEKALFPNMSSYLLIAWHRILYQKIFITWIRALSHWQHALYWLHSLPKRLFYPIWVLLY